MIVLARDLDDRPSAGSTDRHRAPQSPRPHSYTAARTEYWLSVKATGGPLAFDVALSDEDGCFYARDCCAHFVTGGLGPFGLEVTDLLIEQEASRLAAVLSGVFVASLVAQDFRSRDNSVLSGADRSASILAVLQGFVLGQVSLFPVSGFTSVEKRILVCALAKLRHLAPRYFYASSKTVRGV